MEEKSEFFLNEEKRYKRGKLFMNFMVVYFIINTIVSIPFGQFNFISFIFSAIVLFMMYIGRTWAKWLYIISGILSIGLVVGSAMNLAGDIKVLAPTYLLVMGAIQIVVFIFILVMLLKSKDVEVFLYRQLTSFK